MDGEILEEGTPEEVFTDVRLPVLRGEPEVDIEVAVDLATETYDGVETAVSALEFGKEGRVTDVIFDDLVVTEVVDVVLHVFEIGETVLVGGDFTPA